MNDDERAQETRIGGLRWSAAGVLEELWEVRIYGPSHRQYYRGEELRDRRVEWRPVPVEPSRPPLPLRDYMMEPDELDRIFSAALFMAKVDDADTPYDSVIDAIRGALKEAGYVITPAPPPDRNKL